MLCRRCAGTESRRAEIAEPGRLNQSYLPRHSPSSIRSARILRSKGSTLKEFESGGGGSVLRIAGLPISKALPGEVSRGRRV